MLDTVTTAEHRLEIAALRADALRRSARRRSPGRLRRRTGTALVRLGLLLASDGPTSSSTAERAAHPSTPACAGVGS